MGNCSGYCNACGDESTQIKTLDNNQLKQSMKEKEQYTGNGTLQHDMSGYNNNFNQHNHNFGVSPISA